MPRKPADSFYTPGGRVAKRHGRLFLWWNMAKAREMLIGFPQAGLDRKVAYRQRSPFATNDCLNVRSTETIENRDRGGSRPGLGDTSVYDSLGSEVRLLSPMVLAPEDKFTILREHFRGDTLSSVWEINNPIEGFTLYPLPTLTGEGRVTNDLSEEDNTSYAVHTLNSIDTTRPCLIRRRIELSSDIVGGFYEIFARLNDTTPSTWTDGLVLGIRMFSSGNWRFRWVSIVDEGLDLFGVSAIYPAVPGTQNWITAKLNGNVIISLSYGNVELALNLSHANHSGARVGFGLQTNVGTDPLYDSAFEVEYFTTLVVPSFFHRRLLVASAGGNLYTEWQE